MIEKIKSWFRADDLSSDLGLHYIISLMRIGLVVSILAIFFIGLAMYIFKYR